MLRILGMIRKSAGARTPVGDVQRPPSRAWPLLALAAIIPLAGCQDLDTDIAQRNNARALRAAAERQAQQQGVDLANVGYNIGDPNAPVTVIEFSDFGCQFCGTFARESFPALRKEFIDTGKVRWKYIPFVLGIFPNGDRAAIAGMCAAAQGNDAFWQMHDLLYQKQREWKSIGDGARALFERYAAELQLDTRRFANCYDTARPGPELTRNIRLGQQLGVRATPTFFINGARVEGAIPLDLFRRVLQEASAH